MLLPRGMAGCSYRLLHEKSALTLWVENLCRYEWQKLWYGISLLDPNGSHFFMDNYGIQNFVATSISDVGMLSPVFDTLIQ